MILSQTDLILRAIQVTSLRATALCEDTPLAPTTLPAPLEQGRQIRLTRSGEDLRDRGKGLLAKGQLVAPQFAARAPWKQAGSEIPSTCSP